VSRQYTQVDFNTPSADASNSAMDYVLRYKLLQEDSGAVIAEIKLIRKDGKVELPKRYRIAKIDEYIFIVHAIAYDVNTLMGGAPVEWMKKRVVLSRLVSPNNSEILVTDYTLTHQFTILKGGLYVFPKWGDTEQQTLYVTDLSGRRPALFKINTRTGQMNKLLESDGMLICSDVSDDGKRLLLTMAPSGQPDVYVYYTDTKKYQRVTNYNGIDVNGQFMPDNQIAFVSNRLGYPNIYTKRIGGSSVEQMVNYGKSNSACSSYKDYIVYKARESANAFSPNTFNLHLISTKTPFIRRLTATGKNEFPRFSDDGDAILFIKNYQEQSSIGIIRLKYNKNFLFPLAMGKIQSLDW
jgi:TolB protein